MPTARTSTFTRHLYQVRVLRKAGLWVKPNGLTGPSCGPLSPLSGSGLLRALLSKGTCCGGNQPDIQDSSPCPLCKAAHQARDRTSPHSSSHLDRGWRSPSDQPCAVLDQAGRDSQARQGDHAQTEETDIQTEADQAGHAMRARHLDPLRLGFAVAITAVILAACGSADQASLPTTGASAAVLAATATPAPTASPPPAPTPAPHLH